MSEKDSIEVAARILENIHQVWETTIEFDTDDGISEGPLQELFAAVLALPRIPTVDMDLFPGTPQDYPRIKLRGHGSCHAVIDCVPSILNAIRKFPEFTVVRGYADVI